MVNSGLLGPYRYPSSLFGEALAMSRTGLLQHARACLPYYHAEAISVDRKQAFAGYRAWDGGPASGHTHSSVAGQKVSSGPSPQHQPRPTSPKI